MAEYKLRDYQQECEDIIDNLKPGSYLCVLATGLGKTMIFSHIRRRGRVLILSHREELVHQPEKYYDCSFGVERAEETSNGEEVVSASVQTLIHRLNKFKPDDFDMIITDEAHHAVAPSYQKIYSYFKPRIHIGFTATPNRADNTKLGKVFSKVIFDKDIKWGIKNKYLTDIECMRVNIGYDLSKVKVRMGDFVQDQLERAVDIEKSNSAIADAYRNNAIGPTLIFAASVSHAYNIANKIPKAEVVTGETKNRAEILENFAKGKIPVLVNCMVLTEGTDLPMVRTIMMCRPTKNASLYVQMVGRGLRLYPGKQQLRLIDCTGVSDLKICTAPVLFGLDENKVNKIKGKDSIMITEMEGLARKAESDELMEDIDSWKMNIKIIKLFEEQEGYDTHDVNYTVCPNKDMICSLGGGVMVSIAAEDLTGHTTLRFTQYGKELKTYRDITMQEAFDQAYESLKNSYAQNINLWDIAKVQDWGSQPATQKQKGFIHSLYTNEELKKINMNGMTKYQAGCLINRAHERIYDPDSLPKKQRSERPAQISSRQMQAPLMQRQSGYPAGSSRRNYLDNIEDRKKRSIEIQNEIDRIVWSTFPK